MKIVFTANGRCASAAVEPAGQPITAGSRGVPAKIHLSPDYDGLVVTAFFRSEYGSWPVVLGETPGTVTIPWEAMEKKSLTFDVGVVGKNGDGTVVIPTIWARAGKIVPATEDSGLEPGDPSADIGAQIVEQARDAAKKAEDAAEAAENARDKMPRIVDGTWHVYNAVTESWEDTGIQAEGQDGVGISGAVLNADYTLKLTFTDGSSYTTPPIRGAQGEQGQIGPTPDISIGTVTTGAAGSQAEATMTGTPERPVLNLTIPRGDPGEVTQAELDALAEDVAANTQGLADQKSAFEDLQDLTNHKAGMLVDSTSGSIVSFVPDATIDNLLGVTVAVEPVQDLNGFDAPWPPGGSGNLIDFDQVIGTGNIHTPSVQLSAGTYYVYVAAPSTQWNTYAQFSTNGGSSFGNITTSTTDVYCSQQMAYSYKKSIITVVNPILFRVRLQANSNVSNVRVRVMLTTESTGYDSVPNNFITGNVNFEAIWRPYSNICPISGWTGATIKHSGADVEVYDTITRTYKDGQGNTLTVYGGTDDVTGGVLTVNRATVSSSNAADFVRNNATSYYIRPALTPDSIRDGTTHGAMSNKFKAWDAQTATQAAGIVFVNGGGAVRFNTAKGYESTAEMIADIGEIQLVYPLATPQTYQLTPTQIQTLVGTNNVWADTGDVDVQYAADLKHYIDSKIAAAVAALS